jgi:hypothetical protein
MNMTPERFAQLVETYGSQPARWPAQERQAAEAWQRENAAAQALCQDYAQLEALLDTLPTPVLSGLEQRVLRRCAALASDSLLDQALDWLLPRGDRLLAWIWRPALVACLPLVCGIYMANYFSFGISGPEVAWEEELALLALNDYAEIAE